MATIEENRPGIRNELKKKTTFVRLLMKNHKLPSGAMAPVRAAPPLPPPPLQRSAAVCAALETGTACPAPTALQW